MFKCAIPRVGLFFCNIELLCAFLSSAESPLRAWLVEGLDSALLGAISKRVPCTRAGVLAFVAGVVDTVFKARGTVGVDAAQLVAG